MPSLMSPQPGDAVFIDPIGGGADDTARMNTIIAFWAYKRRIVMRAGLWTFAAQGVGNIGGMRVVSGSKIDLLPGTILRSTQTKGLVDPAFIFWNAPTVVANGVVSTLAVVGANQFITSLTCAVDSWILVTAIAPNTAVVMQYQVIAVSGAGPFTVTVDRPIVFPFPVNSLVSTITTQVRDIEINGNGATLEGEVDRLIHFHAGYRCAVKGPITGQRAYTAGFPVGAAPDYMFAYTVGSLECMVSDLNAYECVNGFTFNSCERVDATRLSARRVTTAAAGFYVQDCVNFNLNEFSASGYGAAGVGIQISEFGAGTFGCFNVNVRGGRLNGAAGGTGVNLARATDCTVEAVYSEGHLTQFLTSANTVRPTFVGCTSRTTTLTTATGYSILGTGTRMVSCASLGDNLGISVSGATMDRLDITDPSVLTSITSALVIVAGTTAESQVNVTGGVTNGLTRTIDVIGPTNVFFDRTSIGAGAGAFGIIHRAACVVTLQDVTITGGGGGGGGYDSALIPVAGATLRRVGRVRNLAAVPYAFGAGTFVNSANVVLTAAVAVVVAFPDLRVGESPKLTRIAVAGGTGLAPVVVLTPGTGFTLTSVALDLDTYQWEIST